MPRSLIRYSQVRRLGTPDVQESDTAYAEGRYFEANCLAGDLVNHCVRVVGSTLDVPDVTSVDPGDPAKMPAIGVIVQKETSTTCLVQTLGQITSFSPVVPNATYYVGATAFPVTTPPALPANQQVLGVGLTASRLLLRGDSGAVTSNIRTELICFEATSASGPILPGRKGFKTVATFGTITGWRVISDVAATVVLDVWKINGAIPVNGDSITAAARPTILASTFASSALLTGWTTAVVPSDVFALEVESNDLAQYLQLVLTIERS